MKYKQTIMITLNDEEKNVLRGAAEIIEEITSILERNLEQGFTPWQEGLVIPECFWQIYHNCLKIENNELIP